MALTSDNIQTIKQFADKLEKWANNLSYSTSQTKNFWVELILFFYPQDLQVTVSWLANIPTIGQKVQKDFEELSKMIGEWEDEDKESIEEESKENKVDHKEPKESEFDSEPEDKIDEEKEDKESSTNKADHKEPKEPEIDKKPDHETDDEDKE